MCSAEVVLVFAEALRRPVGAQPSGPAGVCRRLFPGGDADPVLVARSMEEELRRQMSSRWNFDFEREVPLPGRFQWVSVGAPQHKQRPVQEVRPHRKPRKKNAGVSLSRQHKITEFMHKKKRPLASDNTSSLKLRKLNIDERTGTTAGPT